MNEEELKIVITAQADKLKSALQNATNQVDNFEKQTTRSTNAMTQGFQKLGAVIGKVFAIGVILKFGKACVDTATQTQNAWIGLNSILTGKTGTTEAFKNAQSFIQDYVKDGLVPLNNAVTAYKNLAMRGYNTEQIETTLQVLKDAATYGRQASYSLGEAVQTATEGLKNENSILVDNAGITKNVSKMWQDYAKSIGKTTNQLTQQEKIQAEVLGMQEEAKYNTGDSARAAMTYSGAISRLTNSFKEMKNSIGEVLQPLVKMLTPALETLFNWISSLFKGITGLLSLFGFTSDLDKVTSSVTGTGESVDNLNSGLEETAKDSKKAKQGLASFDEINNLQQQSGGASATGGGGGANLEATKVNIKETDSAMNNLENKMNNIFKDIDVSNLKESIDSLKDTFKRVADTIKDDLKWAYDNVLVPFAKWTIEEELPALLETFGNALETIRIASEGLKALGVPDFFSKMFNFSTSSLSSTNKFINDIWRGILHILDPEVELEDDYLDTLSEDATTSLGNINKVISAIQGILTPTTFVSTEVAKMTEQSMKDFKAKFEDFKKDLNTLSDFLTNTFKQNWDKAWTGIKDGFATKFSEISVVCKNTMNTAIGYINRMISACETGINACINAINTLQWEVPDWVPFIGGETWGFNFPNVKFSRIPQLARGGIVDGATTFIAGEHGKEAVIPLENNTEWLDNMASRVVTMIQAVNELGTNSVTINVPVEIAGKDFAKATIKDLNLEAIRQGYKPILN